MNGQLGKHLNIPEFTNKCNLCLQFQNTQLFKEEGSCRDKCQIPFRFIHRTPTQIVKAISFYTRNVYFTAHLTVIYLSTDISMFLLFQNAMRLSARFPTPATRAAATRATATGTAAARPRGTSTPARAGVPSDQMVSGHH